MAISPGGLSAPLIRWQINVHTSTTNPPKLVQLTAMNRNFFACFVA